MKIQELTAQSFESLVSPFETYPEGWAFRGSRPCVVDFHAPWCVYCVCLSPILDELAKEFAGRVDFYKVDVDKEPLLEAAFRIRTIPQLLFCSGQGQPVMKLGTLTKAQLKPMIEALLTEG